jgi:hypothetical protein
MLWCRSSISFDQSLSPADIAGLRERAALFLTVLAAVVFLEIGRSRDIDLTTADLSRGCSGSVVLLGNKRL